MALGIAGAIATSSNPCLSAFMTSAFMSEREFAIITIDTSKSVFLSIQYLEGIKWSFGIYAISSALRKSNISVEQPRASMSRSRPCRGRSRI